MRTKLFEAVLLVGVHHHRWHVMGVAASLLESVKDPADVQGLCNVVRNRADEIEAIKGYITRSNLHSVVRSLIPKE